LSVEHSHFVSGADYRRSIGCSKSASHVANVMTELPKIDWPKVTGGLILWTDRRQKSDKATVGGDVEELLNRNAGVFQELVESTAAMPTASPQEEAVGVSADRLYGFGHIMALGRMALS
jgi:hypothetical protein